LRLLFSKLLPKNVASLPAEGDLVSDVLGGKRGELVTADLGELEVSLHPAAALRRWRRVTCKLNQMMPGTGGSLAALAHIHSHSPGRKPAGRLGPRLGSSRGQHLTSRVGRQI